MATRAATLKHVFDIIDLPEESRKYLIEKEGLRNVTALAQNTNAQFIGIRNRSNDVIHHSDVNFLQIFSKWYNEEYLDEEITEDLEEVFTERVWEMYLSQEIRKQSTSTPLPDPPFSTSTRNKEATNTPKINTKLSFHTTAFSSPTRESLGSTRASSTINTAVKPDLRAYPTFNGSFSTWATFKKCFKAVARAQKFGVLLKENYQVPLDPAAHITHVEANEFLYSALEYSTAEGTANTKVEKFKETEDGREAYLHLVDWYESGGQKESLAIRAAEKIDDLKLTRNTVGGAEKYINDFEAALMQSKDAGEPLSPRMSKYRFLKGILDSSLESYVAICRSDITKTYQDCINKIRRATVAQDVVQGTIICRSRRKINYLKGKKNPNEGDLLPKFIWEMLTLIQKSKWRKHRSIKVPTAGKPIPKQYNNRQIAMVDTSQDDAYDDVDYVTDDDTCEIQEIEENDQDDHGKSDD